MVKTLDAKKMALVSQKEVQVWLYSEWRLKVLSRNQTDLGLSPHLTLLDLARMAYHLCKVEVIIMQDSVCEALTQWWALHLVKDVFEVVVKEPSRKGMVRNWEMKPYLRATSHSRASPIVFCCPSWLSVWY